MSPCNTTITDYQWLLLSHLELAQSSEYVPLTLSCRPGKPLMKSLMRFLCHCPALIQKSIIVLFSIILPCRPLNDASQNLGLINAHLELKITWIFTRMLHISSNFHSKDGRYIEQFLKIIGKTILTYFHNLSSNKSCNYS